MAGLVVDGQHIEAAWTFANVAFGEKAFRGANDHMLLVWCDAEFRKRGHLVAYRARSDFDKRKCFTVIADEVEFAFAAARRIVFRNEHIAVTAQIPVSVSLSANSSASCLLLLVIGRNNRCVITQTAPRGPGNRLIDQM